MSEVAKKWYVVRTAGGKEKKAKEYIEKEIDARGLNSYLTQVLIPTEKYYQVKNGKRVLAERLFYPGYLLVEAVMTGEIQHVLRNITYVAGFLSEGKNHEPVPVRESEMNRIMGRVDEFADQEVETENPFVIGEAVKIIDGPFNGFDGTIDEITADKRKLKVMVKIFGRKTLLELNFAQVTKE
ncbi:MAG: transcription termination/antitermination factor NusG [Bacteroidales bacterium]|nr:transcription termination/antitermination factor NusG [Candidatus Cacconaster scatequi]